MIRRRKGQNSLKDLTYSDLSFLAWFMAAWEKSIRRQGDNGSKVPKNTAPATDGLGGLGTGYLCCCIRRTEKEEGFRAGREE